MGNEVIKGVIKGRDKGSELVGQLIIVKVEVDVVEPPWWL